jgi:hypothetical protein
MEVLKVGTALVLGIVILPLFIKQMLEKYDRWKRIRDREKMFFDRNPYATVLYKVKKGETTRWS